MTKVKWRHSMENLFLTLLYVWPGENSVFTTVSETFFKLLFNFRNSYVPLRCTLYHASRRGIFSSTVIAKRRHLTPLWLHKRPSERGQWRQNQTEVAASWEIRRRKGKRPHEYEDEQDKCSSQVWVCPSIHWTYRDLQSAGMHSMYQPLQINYIHVAEPYQI